MSEKFLGMIREINKATLNPDPIPTPEEKRAQLQDVKHTYFYNRVLKMMIMESTKMDFQINVRDTDIEIVYSVIEELKKSGWQARIIQDSREGNYLDIREPKDDK